MQSEHILQFLPAALLVLDQDYKVLYCNSRAEEIFDLSSKRMQGKPIADVWLNFNPSELHIEQEPNLVLEQHCIIGTAAGHEFNGLASITMDESRNIYCLIRPFHQDQQLIEQQYLSQQMMRALAHEIKNPLGGIQGAAQLLAMDSQSAETREYTQVITREVERLKNLIDRMTTTAQKLELREFNVHEVTEKCRQVLALNLEQGLQINNDYDPSLPEVTTSFDMLYQVALNVMKNAVEASPVPGQVIVRTRAQHHMTIGQRVHKLVLKISIIDQGAGIPQDQQQQIFFPMFSTKSSGTGLGLSIAQSIMITLGGIIEVQSQPGKTQFDICIPCKPLEQNP